jgi:uncharacterized protein YhaN
MQKQNSTYYISKAQIEQLKVTLERCSKLLGAAQTRGSYEVIQSLLAQPEVEPVAAVYISDEKTDKPVTAEDVMNTMRLNGWQHLAGDKQQQQVFTENIANSANAYRTAALKLTSEQIEQLAGSEPSTVDERYRRDGYVRALTEQAAEIERLKSELAQMKTLTHQLVQFGEKPKNTEVFTLPTPPKEVP